jgi:Protein of unknown function (DUF3102)
MERIEAQQTAALESRSSSMTQLAELAASINAEYAHAVAHRDLAISHSRAAMQHALQVGQLLSQAKAQLPHGAWIAWLEAHTVVPRRTASARMRLARNEQHVAHMPVGEALRQLSTPRHADPLPPSEPLRLAQSPSLAEPPLEAYQHLRQEFYRQHSVWPVVAEAAWAAAAAGAA